MHEIVIKSIQLKFKIRLTGNLSSMDSIAGIGVCIVTALLSIAKIVAHGKNVLS